LAADRYGIQAGSLAHDASDPELAELVRLQQSFRAHVIFREVTEARGVRYIACSTTIGVRLHTIITDDLVELRSELERSASAQ
jgi:hypothetical protein